MTALPEAKLAREAEICYAVLAQVTDYDCWHPEHDHVTGDMVLANVARNVANAKAIIRSALPALATAVDCECRHALAGAIATAPDAVGEDVRIRLGPILAPYLSEDTSEETRS
jgi:5'-methylthioadenosine phosphorylase